MGIGYQRAKKIIKKVDGNPLLQFRRHVIFRYSWDMIFKTRLEPMVLDPGSFWK